MATVPTSTGTYLANLFDPQVIADLINTKLINKIVFAPLAKIDRTLQGRAGDTVTLPYYSYIGAAADVNEGTDIPIRKLTQSTTPVTVIKIGVGAQLTDEAVLSGYGDPLGEAADQIAAAIADGVDTKLLAALNANTNAYYTGTAGQAVEPEDIPMALAMYGEENDEAKVLVCDATLYAKLLKEDWIPASQIAAEVRVRGTVGMAYGCQVIVSNRVSGGNYHIIKPGALAIFSKRDTLVETDRDIVNQSTVVTGSKIFAPYLLDSTKAIKLVAGVAP